MKPMKQGLRKGEWTVSSVTQMRCSTACHNDLGNGFVHYFLQGFTCSSFSLLSGHLLFSLV